MLNIRPHKINIKKIRISLSLIPRNYDSKILFPTSSMAATQTARRRAENYPPDHSNRRDGVHHHTIHHATNDRANKHNTRQT